MSVADAVLDRRNDRVVAHIGARAALVGALVGAAASLLGGYLAAHLAAEASREVAVREGRAAAYREFLQSMDAFAEAAGVTRSCAGLTAAERSTIGRCSTLDGTIAAGVLRLRVAGDAIVVAGPDSARAVAAEFTGRAVMTAEPLAAAQTRFAELKTLHQQVVTAPADARAAARKRYDAALDQVLALLRSPDAQGITEATYEDYRRRLQEIMKAEASS